jgi:hypothetical protein
MESPTDLAKRVDEDTDDVLATLPLVSASTAMVDRLYLQLVDLLLEGIVIDLRARLADGLIDSATFAEELAELARQCRAVGLVPRT